MPTHTETSVIFNDVLENEKMTVRFVDCVKMMENLKCRFIAMLRGRTNYNGSYSIIYLEHEAFFSKKGLMDFIAAVCRRIGTVRGIVTLKEEKQDDPEIPGPV